MIESEYNSFLCDGLIQSSAGRVHNLRKIGDDIPRLIEWAGGVRISANNRALDPGCLLTRQMRKRLSVIRKSKKDKKHHLHLCGSL